MSALSTKPRHLTYATRAYLKSARTLQQQMTAAGFASHVFTPSSPVVRQLRHEHRDVMSAARGAGYWLWKPAIILAALEQAQEGDIVLYSDAGVALIGDPWRLLSSLPDAPVVLFEHPPHPEDPNFFMQRRWTRRDCFVLLDADTETHWQRPQLSAGFQLYRNGPEARRFVAANLQAAKDLRIIGDGPNTTGTDNFPDFIAHRHDQSILTILATRVGVPTLPFPAADGPAGPAVFDLFRRRPSWLFTATAGLRGVLRPRRRLEALRAGLTRRFRR